jgi:hypothetical protein
MRRLRDIGAMEVHTMLRTRTCSRLVSLSVPIVTMMLIGKETQVTADVVIRPIAVSGNAAPGTSTVFSNFGDGTGEPVPFVDDKRHPRMDQHGQVVFHAHAGPPTINGNQHIRGIWRSTIDGVQPVAMQNQQAFGMPAGVTFTGFPDHNFVMTPAINQGSIAFMGGLQGQGIDVFSGLWLEQRGSFVEVFPDIGPIPTLPEGSELHGPQKYFLGPDGSLAVVSLFVHPNDACGGCFHEDKRGIWIIRPDGTLEFVARGGYQAPGMPAGIVFGEHDPQNALFGAHYFQNANDNLSTIAFVGNVTGPGITNFNDQGVWHWHNGAIDLVMREGDPAPFFPIGTVFGTGSGIQPISFPIRPQINPDGALLFSAVVKGPDNPFMNALWTTRNGPLELITYGCEPFSDSAPGAHPPGLSGEWTFSGFLTARIGDQGHIVFTGMATPNMTVLINYPQGIWWDVPGELALIAFEGDPVPDLPSGTTFHNLGNPAVGPWLLIDHSNRAVFSAELAGPGINLDNDLGLFMVDASGIRTLVRSGDVIDVSGAGDLRTIRAFRVGSGVSDNNEFAVRLFFTDNSNGLFAVRVPPDDLPGDVNGDGTVNVDDLLTVILEWGPCPQPPQACDADVNSSEGDGVVDVDDLIAVILNWG